MQKVDRIILICILLGIVALLGVYKIIKLVEPKAPQPKPSQTFEELVTYKKSLNIPNKSITADNNKNHIPETYTLENGILTISEGSKIIWTSSQKWWTDDFALADSNHDGQTEVNLSVWKAGSFGSSKPFWIKENDMSVRNHFFVFHWSEAAISAVWQSSNLGVPNCQFKFSDTDHDKKQELVVIEGSYETWPKCEGKYTAIWKWNFWGFANEWRGSKGDLESFNKY